VAWHYLQIELSVLIMLLFLSTLIQLFLKTKTMALDLSLTQRFILQTPFIVYLGWISVATIGNITALLVAYKWTALNIAPVYWSAVMILIAIVLAVLMVKKFQVVSFTLVVAWALWGIYNAQGPAAPILASLTALGIGVLISTVLFTLIYKLRKNKMA
jgi:benzodiazapine receptor